MSLPGAPGRRGPWHSLGLAGLLWLTAQGSHAGRVQGPPVASFKHYFNRASEKDASPERAKRAEASLLWPRLRSVHSGIDLCVDRTCSPVVGPAEDLNDAAFWSDTLLSDPANAEPSTCSPGSRQTANGQRSARRGNRTLQEYKTRRKSALQSVVLHYFSSGTQKTRC